MSVMGREMGVADRLVAAMGRAVDLSRPNTALSLFYSDIGLGFAEDQGGITRLYTYYNRRANQLGNPVFFALPGRVVSHERTAIGVTQSFEGGSEADFAFYGHNTWICELRGFEQVEFSIPPAPVPRRTPQMPPLPAEPTPLAELRRTPPQTKASVVEEAGLVVPHQYIYEAYLPTNDTRDPDAMTPVVLGVRAIVGSASAGSDVLAPVIFRPDASGRLVICFSYRALDVRHEPLIERLAGAPPSAADAMKLSRDWLQEALGQIRIDGGNEQESAVLAKAAYALVSNAVQAPGRLNRRQWIYMPSKESGRIAAFPSRGGYATHFLWDACFQNLALEYMHKDLAPDSLRLLTDNLREDGKMSHFLCSTWMRPHESQPPLAGWAALRLYKQRKDDWFAGQMLMSLVANTQWWLDQRMTRGGLIGCPGPLETGWDDTPRFDRGPVLPLDMNSYLILQMRCCAQLPRDRQGDKPNSYSERLLMLADRLSQRMLELMYDPQENLFKDVLVSTGERLSIKTPACFLPLLADVPLEESKARGMIERYLLNEKHFFGAVPFPCVAYDEPEYRPEKWWRGPTWPPVAYFMLEILKKYGYDLEWRAAASRLYGLFIRDGELHEVFNSQTGAGMANKQQGWTAAICLRLKMELGG